jgi:Golgi phosphoprotein 3
MLSLAEELLLIAFDDDRGVVLTCDAILDYGLVGAVLSDLILQNRLSIEQGKVVVVQKAATGDDILDSMLTQIDAAPPKAPQEWVVGLSGESEHLRDRLLERLIDKGILRREEHKVLWVLSSPHYPMQDRSSELESRDRIRAAVINGKQPDPRTTALISLVKACKLIGEVFSETELPLSDRRIPEIINAGFAGKSVTDMVNCIDESTLAAIRAAAAVQ